MSEHHDFCYIFHTIGYGDDSRKKRKFIYVAKEKWKDDKIRETVNDIVGKRYRVQTIELIEREGVKPKVTTIPVPEPTPKI